MMAKEGHYIHFLEGVMLEKQDSMHRNSSPGQILAPVILRAIQTGRPQRLAGHQNKQFHSAFIALYGAEIEKRRTEKHRSLEKLRNLLVD